MNMQKKRILITGATSFVACRIISRLLQDNLCEQINCLVHTPEKVDLLPEDKRLRVFFGDLRHRDEVKEAFSGVELVLNIAPIFLASAVVKICEELSIARVLFISSARKYSRLYAKQAEQIAECERIIAQSSLDYIILRPTMIYGDPRDRNINPLIRYIRRYRFFPLPYRGERLLRPLFVEDLVELILRLMREEKFGRRAYDLPGPEALSARELMRQLSREMQIKFYLCLLPDWLSNLLVFILTKIPFKERHFLQFLSFTEDRTCEIDVAKKDLGFAPRPFVEGLYCQLPKGE